MTVNVQQIIAFEELKPQNNSSLHLHYMLKWLYGYYGYVNSWHLSVELLELINCFNSKLSTTDQSQCYTKYAVNLWNRFTEWTSDIKEVIKPKICDILFDDLEENQAKTHLIGLLYLLFVFLWLLLKSSTTTSLCYKPFLRWRLVTAKYLLTNYQQIPFLSLQLGPHKREQTITTVKAPPRKETHYNPGGRRGKEECRNSLYWWR